MDTVEKRIDGHDDGHDGGTGSGARRLVVCLAIGFLLAWLVHAADGWFPPRAGEGLAVRWLRALAAHPVRGGLAIGLLALAALARPGTAALARREAAGRDRESAEPPPS